MSRSAPGESRFSGSWCECLPGFAGPSCERTSPPAPPPYDAPEPAWTPATTRLDPAVADLSLTGRTTRPLGPLGRPLSSYLPPGGALSLWGLEGSPAQALRVLLAPHPALDAVAPLDEDAAATRGSRRHASSSSSSTTTTLFGSHSPTSLQAGAPLPPDTAELDAPRRAVTATAVDWVSSRAYASRSPFTYDLGEVYS